MRVSLNIEDVKSCAVCKYKLHPQYIKYRDTNGSPYCRECYIQIGGVV